VPEAYRKTDGKINSIVQTSLLPQQLCCLEILGDYSLTHAQKSSGTIQCKQTPTSAAAKKPSLPSADWGEIV